MINGFDRIQENLLHGLHLILLRLTNRLRRTNAKPRNSLFELENCECQIQIIRINHMKIGFRLTLEIYSICFRSCINKSFVYFQCAFLVHGCILKFLENNIGWLGLCSFYSSSSPSCTISCGSWIYRHSDENCQHLKSI